MSALRERVRAELAQASKREAVAASTRGEHLAKERAWRELAAEGRLQVLRDCAREVKNRVLEHHEAYLRQFAAQVERLGGRIYFASSGEAAVAQVLAIIRQAGARRIVKAKSMVSEEIGLTPALEEAGFETIETDLGEYIVQLAGQAPSHITGPAIHLNAEEIAGIFRERLGEEVPPNPEALAVLARRRLREKFLTADVGITGANFGVAETGSIVLVTNEGNADLATALPRVMIVIMGIEKLVPDWEGLEPLLTLLPRTATGQRMTVYVTAITGPMRPGEWDGPEELHVVLLDNGRSRLLGTKYQDVLRCMRCGACLDACPVFRQVGGHGYGSVYSGPIGVALTPLLKGAAADELLDLCSVCGACTENCPVQIPLHRLILEQRADRAAGRPGPADQGPWYAARQAAPVSGAAGAAARYSAGAGAPGAVGRLSAGIGAYSAERQVSLAERWLFRLWAWAWSDSRRYRAAAWLAARLAHPFSRQGYLTWFPGPLAEWGRERDFPAPALRPFHERWPELEQEEEAAHEG